MIWHTLKVGAQLIKRVLFWIFHSGSSVLFLLDSWDGHPPILSSCPHPQSLYDVFTVGDWDTIKHYNIVQSIMVWLLPTTRSILLSSYLEGLRMVGRSLFTFCILMFVILCRALMFCLGMVPMCLGSTLCLLVINKWIGNYLWILTSHGGSKFGMSSLGLSVISSCGW